MVGEVDSLETEGVVVGAGLAGLSAARELKRLGVDFAVVEARDRAGVETATRWAGYTDRALNSGIRAAIEIVEGS